MLKDGEGGRKPVLLVCNFESETSVLFLAKIYQALREVKRFDLFSWAAIGRQEKEWEDVEILERTDFKRLR